MRMSELYDEDDDGGLSDYEEFRYSLAQAEFELNNDPAYAIWLEYTRVHNVH